MPPKPITLEQFVARADELHRYKYDYSLVRFYKTSDSVVIVCPEHGPWEQVVAAHLRGQGCRKCVSAARTLTTVSFVKKANAIHNNRYDYSEVVYKDSRTKVVLRCPEHGRFEQVANVHLSGRGCYACGHETRETTASFIEKARALHGDRYDYSQVAYANSRRPVTIICPGHGPFEQVPSGHLAGYGCRRCYDESRLIPQEEFIRRAQKAHGEFYDYSQTVYVNKRTKVVIGCPVHGLFRQDPDKHLKGSACSKCKTKSIGEKLVRASLRKLGVDFEEQKTFATLKNPKTGRSLYYDFFVPAFKLLIEFDGSQHSSLQDFIDLSRGQRTEADYALFLYRDRVKDEYAAENGLLLLRISHRDRRQVLDLIQSKLNQIEVNERLCPPPTQSGTRSSST